MQPADIRITLAAALAVLTPNERTVLDLIYRLGLTQKQVAARLTLSEKVVSAAASHGLQRIGELLSFTVPRTV